MNQPIGMCTVCTEEKVNSYAVLSKNGVEVTCPRGHTFKDVADFNDGITKGERKKMNKEMDKNAEEIFGTRKPNEGTVSAIVSTQPGDLSINELDKARLEALLGEFNSSSDLVGLVYAMKEGKNELETTMKNAKKVKVGEEDGTILLSGDLRFSGVVPERHVMPLIDLAHSWNRSATDYINERLIELFDSMLFY